MNELVHDVTHEPARFEPEPQYFTGLSYEGYDRLGGLRSGHLKKARISMAHYVAACEKDEDEEEKKESDALRFGRIFHTALLEPDDYNHRSILKPDFGSGEGSRKRKWEWEDKMATTRPDALILKNEAEKNRVDKMALSFLNHGLTKRIFGVGHKGDRESVIVWRNPETGVVCKARLDFWTKEAQLHDDAEKVIMALDLKSTTIADSELFAKDAYKHGYHLSCAHYLEGLSVYLGMPVQDFAFVAVEKEPPYGVRYFIADPQFIECGQEQRLACLKKIAEAQQTNVWPSYPEYFNNLFLPDWVARKAEDRGTYAF